MQWEQAQEDLPRPGLEKQRPCVFPGVGGLALHFPSQLSGSVAATCVTSRGCRHTVPHTGWVKTTEMDCLTFPEARRLKSGYRQGHAPSADLGVSFSGWPQVFPVLWMLQSNPTLSWCPPCLFLCVCLCPHFPFLEG